MVIMPKDKTIDLTKRDLPEISSREKIEVPHLEYGMGERFGGFTITPDDMTRGDKSLADIVDSGIDNVINDRINTQTAEILAEWTFGASGAFAMKTDENNGLWISPTGILAKNAGNSTFTITASGDATFTGTIAAGAVISADISADNITAGTLSVDRISAGSITSSKIGSDLDDDNISSINFNNITASNISADDITAGTLTGITIQTATTGKRLRMMGSPANEYQFLDGNDEVGYLKIADDGSGGYYSEIYIDHLGPAIKVGSTIGAAESVYFSAPFFSSSGRDAMGYVLLTSKDSKEFGITWSGGGTPYLTSNMYLDMGNNQIRNMSDPSSDLDAATKGYVDGEVQAIEDDVLDLADVVLWILDNCC